MTIEEMLGKHLRVRVISDKSSDPRFQTSVWRVSSIDKHADCIMLHLLSNNKHVHQKACYSKLLKEIKLGVIEVD